MPRPMCMWCFVECGMCPDVLPKARNWEEDYGHENGDYINTCVKCNNIFFGHKRRVVCKVCDINGKGENNAIEI
jgi:hypothetical protein